MPSVNWSSAIAAHLNLDADTTTKRGALLAEIGGGVQSIVEQTIGRTFDVRDYAETYSGTDRDFLYLRHDPIVSVSRLVVCGTEVEVAGPDGLTFPPPAVVVDGLSRIRYTTGLVFPAGVANVAVEYRAGFGTVPPALLRACVMWAALIFKNRDRIGMSSQSAGGQSVAFHETPPEFVNRAMAAWTRWSFSSC